MGKLLDKLKKVNNITDRVERAVNDNYNRSFNKRKKYNDKIMSKSQESLVGDTFDDMEDTFNDFGMDDYGDDYGAGIQPSQKPESFHHFILENQYKDLEKSIRGYKDVYNKTTREWEIKRKGFHCFTDEEAEEILRTAQSLLATDIKLSFINKEVFGYRMMMLYKRLKQLFREIAEYRYGRYSHDENGKMKPNGYAIEQQMKLQNLKIFLELTERVVANYSRAIQGMENHLTHQSVSGQESLQSSQSFDDTNRRYS